MKKKKKIYNPYVKWFPRIPPKWRLLHPKFEKIIKNWVFDQFSKCLYQNVCMDLYYDQKKQNKNGANPPQNPPKPFKNPKFWVFG